MLLPWLSIQIVRLHLDDTSWFDFSSHEQHSILALLLLIAEGKYRDYQRGTEKSPFVLRLWRRIAYMRHESVKVQSFSFILLREHLQKGR